MHTSPQSQIQREREIGVHFLIRNIEPPLVVTVGEKAAEAAAFSFVGVDREGGVAAAARMRYVVSATAEAAFVPGVVEVEGERRMDANGWVQTLGRLPGAVTHTGHAFAIDAGG